MKIRPAKPEDVATIVGWRMERSRWLAGQGSDQWGSAGLAADSFASRVRASVEEGETWIAEHGNEPVGTIAVDRWTDAGLWTDSEIADALFIHRLIAPLSSKGLDVGTALIDHAEDLAISAGRRWLRLDAWTSNRQLHNFWSSHGFRHVRTVPGTPSGALFQRPVVGAG